MNRFNTTSTKIFLTGFLLSSAVLTQSTLAQNYIPPPLNPAQLVPVLPQPDTKTLLFHGNVAVQTDLLLKVMKVGADRVLTEEEMQRAVETLRQFYQLAGFSLAQIEVRPRDGGWTVYIDEGMIGNIYIYGLDWYETFALRRELFPTGIFNLVRLENTLGEWQKRIRAEQVSYEIEKTEPKGSEQPLVALIKGAEGLLPQIDIVSLLRDRAQHNLYIYFGQPGLISGFRFGLGYSSRNGVEFREEYTRPALLLERDIFELGGFVGLARRGTVDPARQGQKFYSNAGALARWFTPPLGADWFRLSLDTDLANDRDQRPDLPLDRYSRFRVDPGLRANFEVRPRQTISVTLGYDYQRLYQIDMVPSQPFTVPVRRVDALWTSAGVELMFGRPRYTYFYNHTLTLRASTAYRGHNKLVNFQEGRYRNTFPGRRFDILMQSSLYLAFGDLQFFDEMNLQALGMTSSFDRQFFVRKGFNQTGEFRLNLYRRDVQLGIFDDFAFFGRVNRSSGNEHPQVANAVGLRAYLLFYDAFQASIGYAFGLAGNGDTSHDLTVGLEKIF